MDGLLAFLGSKVGLLIRLLLAAVGVYLLWNHTGHVVLALPYLILLGLSADAHFWPPSWRQAPPSRQWPGGVSGKV